jgi:hypothetical protein
MRRQTSNYSVHSQRTSLLNRGMVGKKLFTPGVGYAGNIGVKFDDGHHAWNLVWRTATPGVILYTYRILGLSAEDRAIAAEIRKAEDEGRTVDAKKREQNLKADSAANQARIPPRWPVSLGVLRSEKRGFRTQNLVVK